MGLMFIKIFFSTYANKLNDYSSLYKKSKAACIMQAAFGLAMAKPSNELPNGAGGADENNAPHPNFLILAPEQVH